MNKSPAELATDREYVRRFIAQVEGDASALSDQLTQVSAEVHELIELHRAEMARIQEQLQRLIAEQMEAT